MSDITYVTLGVPAKTYVSITQETVQITAQTKPVYITAQGFTGPQGIQGPQGDSTTWQVMTQAAYNSITPIEGVLYVIID